MVALWLPRVFNMLEDIPHQCPIIKDHVMDGQGSAIAAFNTLAAQTCVALKRVLFLDLSGSVGGNSSIYNKALPTVFKRREGWCAQKGVPNSTISASN